MKKIVIYKVTTKYSIEIETENIYEEKLIEELNKEFERQLKQDKTYHARTVSLEYSNQMYTFIFYDSTNEKEWIKFKKVDIETTHCLTIDDDGTLYGIKNGDIDFEFIDSIFPSYSN